MCRAHKSHREWGMTLSDKKWVALSLLVLTACGASPSDNANTSASVAATSTAIVKDLKSQASPQVNPTSDPLQVDLAFLATGNWMPNGMPCGTATGNFWQFSADKTYAAPGTYGVFKLLDGGTKLQVKFDDEMSGKGTETLSIKREGEKLIIDGGKFHRCKNTNR